MMGDETSLPAEGEYHICMILQALSCQFAIVPACLPMDALWFVRWQEVWFERLQQPAY